MEYLLIIPGRLDNLNDFIRADKASRYKGGEMKKQNEDIVSVYIRKCLRDVNINKKYLWNICGWKRIKGVILTIYHLSEEK